MLLRIFSEILLLLEAKVTSSATKYLPYQTRKSYLI